MANINHLALLILGFDESYVPTRDELAQAFRTASLKFHPDAGGNALMFRGLTLAKEVVEGILPVPKKPKQTSTETKYNNTYQSDEARIQELYIEIMHHARMAAINLSRASKRVKEITITTEDYGILTISCKNKWDVTNVGITSRFHKDRDVLAMFNSCLDWVRTQDRSKYKESTTIKMHGKLITVKFNYELEPWWKFFVI